MFTLNPTVILIALLVLLGATVGGYAKGRQDKQAEWDTAKLAIANKTVEIKDTQAIVTTQVEAKHEEAKEVIRTVFRDRLIYQTKEVPYEVIVREDAGCIIPNRFVGLWNSANRGKPFSSTPGELDEAPSGVKLSDIAEQKDRESEDFLVNLQQLKDLQAWVLQQQAVK